MTVVPQSLNGILKLAFQFLCYYLQSSTRRFQLQSRNSCQLQIIVPLLVKQSTGSDTMLLCIQLTEYTMFAGTPFPLNFKEVVKTIFKRLFRVYAHIYHSHFQKIVSLKEEAHLNTCFKHFTLFTWVCCLLILLYPLALMRVYHLLVNILVNHVLLVRNFKIFII